MDIRNVIRRPGQDSCIDADERVVFFPTDADFAAGQWHVPVHGWIYRPTEWSRLRRAGLWLVKQALRRRVPRDDKAKALFQQRVGAFLADNERWNRVQIQLGEAVFKLKRSRANGHFAGNLELSPQHVAHLLQRGSSPHAAAWVSFRALTKISDDRVFDGCVRFLPPEGLSVISDIDDTIKVTEVASRRKMLRNTFVRDFVSVPEMAALYRQWEDQRGAAFHYVSASPWHLYPFLAEFLTSQGFPDGTFYLRYFRLMPGDLRRTLRPGRRVKIKHARELLRRYPQRKFWLVGDSGESDAAMYAKLYCEFPAQVERILIRDVGGGEMTASRWEKAFRRVPKQRWLVFQNASEVR